MPPQGADEQLCGGEPDPLGVPDVGQRAQRDANGVGGGDQVVAARAEDDDVAGAVVGDSGRAFTTAAGDRGQLERRQPLPQRREAGSWGGPGAAWALRRRNRVHTPSQRHSGRPFHHTAVPSATARNTTPPSTSSTPPTATPGGEQTSRDLPRHERGDREGTQMAPGVGTPQPGLSPRTSR